MRVLTYGTFDLFHIGHLNLLRRLKSIGNYLCVGISTDEFNNKKGKACTIPFEHRMDIVGSLKYVDYVFPEISWEQKVEDIDKYKIDIFAMGDDWTGKFDFLSSKCKILYLPRTLDISSSSIKSDIKKYI